jgi:hypothetical protein
VLKLVKVIFSSASLEGHPELPAGLAIDSFSIENPLKDLQGHEDQSLLTQVCVEVLN